MTWFEVYALFGGPIIVLAIGAAVYRFTAPKDHMHPGE